MIIAKLPFRGVLRPFGCSKAACFLVKCPCIASSAFAGPNPISSAFEYQRNRKDLETDRENWSHGRL